MDLKPRINIVTLGVRDVSLAKAFYEKLGLTPHAMSNENIGFYAMGGVTLAIYGHTALAEDAKMHAATAPSFRGVSLAWNTASEVEVDTLFRHAIACGASAVKAPEKVFWGGYSGYFADPDNHLWEVAYNPFVTITPEGLMQLP
jgi:uncharacterized protein